MTVHCCRDLVVGTQVGYASGAYDTMWALSVFMQGVLGFRTDSSAGNLLPPTISHFTASYYGLVSPPSTFAVLSSSVVSFSSGTCFISSSGARTLLKFSTDVVNLMSAAYPASWPLASGSWPTGDPFMGDWVALRSATYPLANSGIFAVINTTAWLDQNALEIDYRTVTPTLQETGSALTASFWLPPPSSDISTAPGRGLSRTAVAWSTFNALQGNGDASGYQGDGSSTLPRVILTSPSSSPQWKARLCFESTQDVSFGGTVFQGSALTVIPGISGSGGDFRSGTLGVVSAQHLHVPQWFDLPFASASAYAGAMPGLDQRAVSLKGINVSSSVGYRFYAWGDDVTGTCVAMVRGQSSSGSQDAFVMFGVADPEVVVSGQPDVSRLFVVGQARANVGVTWNNGTRSDHGITGIAFSTDARLGPVSCVMSSYSFAAYQPNDSSSIRYDAVAGDSPFLGGSELVRSELVAGTWDNLRTSGAESLFPIAPRTMGGVPFARFGRSTGQPRWNSVGDARAWFHVTNGFYLPWGGLDNPVL